MPAGQRLVGPEQQAHRRRAARTRCRRPRRSSGALVFSRSVAARQHEAQVVAAARDRRRRRCPTRRAAAPMKRTRGWPTSGRTRRTICAGRKMRSRLKKRGAKSTISMPCAVGVEQPRAQDRRCRARSSCSTRAKPSSSTEHVPSCGRPCALSSSAWKTGSPSKRGMQHQTIAPSLVDQRADRAVADQRQSRGWLQVGSWSFAVFACATMLTSDRDARGDFSACEHPDRNLPLHGAGCAIAALFRPACRHGVATVAAVLAAGPRRRPYDLQLRFLIPLLLTLVAAAYLALPLMDQLTLRWFARDLNIARRAGRQRAVRSRSARRSAMRNDAALQTLFDRAAQDERLFAIGLCSPDGTLLRRTAAFRRRSTAPRPSA